jgi:hypothetical protein
VPQTEGTSAEVIKQLNQLRADHEGLQVAHRKLLERVMDLELRERHRLPSSTKGPPPSMENLRPAYRSRGSLIKEAQTLLDNQEVPKKQEVDEHGQVKHAR